MLQAPFLAGMEGRVSLNVSIWIGGRLLQAHMDGQVWSMLPEDLNKYVFQKASLIPALRRQKQIDFYKEFKADRIYTLNSNPPMTT